MDRKNQQVLFAEQISMKEMDLVTRVQVLNEAVEVSLLDNAFSKGINLFYCHPSNK